MAEQEDRRKDTKNWSLDEMARYPFLRGAKDFITEKGPPLMDLVEKHGWSSVRMRGKGRILEAIHDGVISTKPLDGEIEQKKELFSYPIARIVVSCVEDNYLTRRYALGESERMIENIRNEDYETISEIGDELDVPSRFIDGNFVTDFTTYLEATDNLKSPEWKLVNQDLREGDVFLNKKRFTRILKEKLHTRLVEELPKPVNDQLIEGFSSQLSEIKGELEEAREEFEEIDFGEVESDKFPPCIKKLISEQNEGTNLSHEARFALTAFLFKIGFSLEDILNLFSESPDFRKDLALYQIEHITGKISGTEYAPPNCGTMKTNGICYNQDSLCKQEWMNHPLQYYSIKKSEEEEREEKDEQDEQENDEG